MNPTSRHRGPDVEAEKLEWLDPTKLEFLWEGPPMPVRLTIRERCTFLRISALRAFPHSDAGAFIQLYSIGPNGERGQSIGILEDVASLQQTARDALRSCLTENYLVPRIDSITEIREVRHLFEWHVVTDRGPHVFEMERIHQNVHLLEGQRAICRDTQDNRYEIADLRQLDAHSRNILSKYL